MVRRARFELANGLTDRITLSSFYQHSRQKISWVLRLRPGFVHPFPVALFCWRKKGWLAISA